MRNYRVFIVNDDQMTRFTLKELIALSELNLEVIGEASDGQEAWRLLKNNYHRIDIILSESSMPHMGGLELLQKIKENSIFEKQIPLFIILSEIMEHDHVRESFIIGAFDYMLKTKLDVHYIKPTLQRAISELEMREKQLYHSKMLNAEYMRVATALHRYSVQAEISSSMDNQPMELNEMVQIIKSQFGDKNIKVASIRFAEHLSSIEDRSLTMQLIEVLSIKKVDKIKGYIWRHNDRQYDIFLSFTDVYSLMEIRNRTHYLLNELLMFLKKEKGIRASIGVSHLSTGIHQLPVLLEQAQQLTEMCFMKGYYRVFYPEMRRESLHYGWKIDWMKFKDHWLQRTRQEEFDYVATDFDQELEKLLDFCPQDRNILVSLLIELVWDTGNVIENHEWLKDEMLFFIETIKNSDTWKNAKQAVIEFMNQYFMQMRNRRINNQNYISPMVIKTKEIVDRHFTEELNLSQISTMLGVSESYLSKQFVKELGVNFISYLTQLRIEKAKLDIKKGLKINDVAEGVGYVNPEHFSRIFKKMTGMSPIVYRKVMQNETTSMVGST